jgi:ubiquitin-like-conjugating enzyme ATG3
VIQDYANRTVTMDPHPHTGVPQGMIHAFRVLSHYFIYFICPIIASIHPCQHAAAMLSINRALLESEVTPTVENYLFYFLKFIQSVVPTIEYDYTGDVQAMANK